jgi:hypothetical protein
MEDGRTVEQGSHATLLDHDGPYSRLYRAPVRRGPRSTRTRRWTPGGSRRLGGRARQGSVSLGTAKCSWYACVRARSSASSSPVAANV